MDDQVSHLMAITSHVAKTPDCLLDNLNVWRSQKCDQIPDCALLDQYLNLIVVATGQVCETPCRLELYQFINNLESKDRKHGVKANFKSVTYLKLREVLSLK